MLPKVCSYDYGGFEAKKKIYSNIFYIIATMIVPDEPRHPDADSLRKADEKNGRSGITHKSYVKIDLALQFQKLEIIMMQVICRKILCYSFARVGLIFRKWITQRHIFIRCVFTRGQTISEKTNRIGKLLITLPNLTSYNPRMI